MLGLVNHAVTARRPPAMIRRCHCGASYGAAKQGAHRWEEAGCGVVGLDDDVLVELLGVQAQRLVEAAALVVVEVHGDVDGVAEEAAPEL